MTKNASKIVTLSLTALLLAMAGCGSYGSDEASGKAIAPPANQNAPLIEEPDLYRQFGSYLYIQNPQTGLNILDVANSKKPRLLGRAKVTGGAGAEIFVKGPQAVVLLKTATSQCRSPKKLEPRGWSLNAEVAIVDVTSKTHPKIQERYCLPGTLVASRTVDDMLYVVTTFSSRGSRAISINIKDPHNAVVVQQLEFPDASKEIIVSAEAIFVAGRVAGDGNRTRVGYIGIEKSGQMTPRGSIELPGAPMGRFHMDQHGAYFRIVTYNQNQRETILSVIDMSDPNSLKLKGELKDIGRWEKLYATRFAGDYAYVVTFRQTDPLWVISLKNPAAPRIVGELHVPGWSDFLFVRGDTLIAVGRGANGQKVGVSLFDVSDHSSPRSLSQVSLGDYSSTSEANVDHRGVTILEGGSGRNALVVVPFTKVQYGSQSCQVKHYLQLVEVQPAALKVRGAVNQQGTIRRSLMVGGQLFSISDYEVLSVDIANMDNPQVATAVTIGADPKASDSKYTQYCGYGMDMSYDDDFHGPFELMCSMESGTSGRGAPVPPLTVLIGLTWLALRLRRRR